MECIYPLIHDKLQCDVNPEGSTNLGDWLRPNRWSPYAFRGLSLTQHTCRKRPLSMVTCSWVACRIVYNFLQPHGQYYAMLCYFTLNFGNFSVCLVFGMHKAQIESFTESYWVLNACNWWLLGVAMVTRFKLKHALESFPLKLCAFGFGLALVSDAPWNASTTESFSNIIFGGFVWMCSALHPSPFIHWIDAKSDSIPQVASHN